MLPDAFFTIDGMFETFLTILNQMDVYEAVIETENRHYLPFLLTTTIMMEAVKAGVGRETAHAAIKEHALATVSDLRNGVANENDLMQRLAGDDRLNLTKEALDEITTKGRTMFGAAQQQVETFSAQVQQIESKYPDAAAYQPAGIL